MGCSGCGNNIKQGKLGTCRFCMTTNLLGAIVGWLTFSFFYFLYPIEKVALIALLISSFFSVFYILHIIFYFIKNKKKNHPS